MTIISVDVKTLGQEMAAWAVPHNYAMLFLEKNTVKKGRVSLHAFFFNDTEHMTSKRHWLAINTAFWCCAYREAESNSEKVEALAGIRSMFYIAGALGAGEIKAMIQEWWRKTYELHQVPAPNCSAVPVTATFH